MGNRVAKHNYDNSGAWLNSTYYVRDAQGNVMTTYVNEPIAGPSVSYRASERPLYGSSRLGMDRNEVEMLGTGSLNLDSAKRILGAKQYELSNHLGNVLTTVSDKKIPIDINSDNTLDWYIPEVLTATDYYAFGQPMYKRNFTNNGSYRYGFNGKEKDDEVYGDGNLTSAEFWEYDTRLGRRWNIDPVVKPWESPYACFADNPIWHNDVRGLDASGNGDKIKPAVFEAIQQGKRLRNEYDLEAVTVIAEGPKSLTTRIGDWFRGIGTQLDHVAEKLTNLVKSTWDFITTTGNYGSGQGGHGMHNYNKKVKRMSDVLADLVEMFGVLKPTNSESIGSSPHKFRQKSDDKGSDRALEEGRKASVSDESDDATSTKPKIRNFGDTTIETNTWNNPNGTTSIFYNKNVDGETVAPASTRDKIEYDSQPHKQP